MTAVVSASPVSGYSMDDDDDSQSWAFVSAGAASFEGSGAPNELVFPAASPSIISQGSWNLVHNSTAMSTAATGQHIRALQTPSPVLSQNADLNANASILSSPPFSSAAALAPASASHNLDHGQSAMGFDFSNMPLNAQQQQQQQQQLVSQALLSEQVTGLAPHDFIYSPHDLMISGLDLPFDTAPLLPDAAFAALEPQGQFASQLDIPLSMQGTADVEPWDPMSAQSDAFVSEQLTTPPPRSDGSSISLSPRSPASPPGRQAPRHSNINSSGHHTKNGGGSKKPSPSANHGVPRKSSGVHKPQRKKASTSPGSGSGSGAGSGSGSGLGLGSPGLSKFKDGVLMFCNQTVDTWGKGHVFGDLDNVERSSQKGRKGALSEEVRANALKVRQTGACFCCHMRKVKCDEARPCKNCVKLCSQVPEVVCWKFPDFLPHIFPDFIRGHFKREETARFVEENVASFTVNGVEAPCIVTLSSGPTFGAKLVVKAKFFTARAATSDVLQQWYQFVGDAGGVDLEVRRAAPIGLEAEGAASGSQRSELRRKVEAYADALAREPTYAVQVTDAVRKTSVPRRVLQIVQQYARTSGQAIVRRALSIYAMYYVLTRQLVMTAPSVTGLQRINPVTAAFMTPRLLNRQIKTVVDDVMQHEVTALFDDFTKRLKHKSRKEWAPCLAAFLVFTLLMEAIETAADVFTITDAETEMRRRQRARFRRAHALDISSGIENMPFRQFALQFHNIYQTHSRDASAKSFNPLAGEGLNDPGDLDPAALDMVLALRNLIQFDCEYLPEPRWQAGDERALGRELTRN